MSLEETPGQPTLRPCRCLRLDVDNYSIVIRPGNRQSDPLLRQVQQVLHRSTSSNEDGSTLREPNTTFSGHQQMLAVGLRAPRAARGAELGEAGKLRERFDEAAVLVSLLVSVTAVRASSPIRVQLPKHGRSTAMNPRGPRSGDLESGLG